MNIIDQKLKLKLLTKRFTLFFINVSLNQPILKQAIFLTFSRGPNRTILNLKGLNASCNTKHCKMESILHVINMIEPGMYFASIDLQDAFYSVTVHKDHQKYLKFLWHGKAYQFICMPNGYCDATRVFTKLAKVPFFRLRRIGHLSIIYVDDSLLMGYSLEECIRNVRDTLHILQSLVFTINFIKCELEPSQTITFLGFIFNSLDMTITLTIEKKQKIFDMAHHILSSQKITIRYAASFIGNLVAALPAVPYGKLYYRFMEHDKIENLKLSKGNYENDMIFSHLATTEVQWWLDNIMSQLKSLLCEILPDMLIFTDASTVGWGANMGSLTINGRWLETEKNFHINILELMAIEIAI